MRALHLFTLIFCSEPDPSALCVPTTRELEAEVALLRSLGDDRAALRRASVLEMRLGDEFIVCRVVIEELIQQVDNRNLENQNIISRVSKSQINLE